MKDIIAQHGGLIATIAALMLALQAVLSGLKMVVEFIIPSPEKQAASPVYKAIGQALALLSKGLDLVQGNVKH